MKKSLNFFSSIFFFRRNDFTLNKVWCLHASVSSGFFHEGTYQKFSTNCSIYYPHEKTLNKFSIVLCEIL